MSPVPLVFKRGNLGDSLAQDKKPNLRSSGLDFEETSR
jgi:hypothetical protein